MSTLTSGLARVTIRAPRRRLDLALPHQVPLAEILPEVLRRAGEITTDPDAARVAPPGGWVLRRGDGASLLGEMALARQGVRDGDVLYLVPRNLTWPEPVYDDIVEEIATVASRRGRGWDASATRVGTLGAAAVVLSAALVLVTAGPDTVVTGLGAAVMAVVLLGGGTLLSRAFGDGLTGAVAGGFSLAYAAVGGALLTGGDGFHPDQLLLGASALLLASAVAAVAIGVAARVFVAGMTVGAVTMLGALLGHAMTGPKVASILVVGAVAGVGFAPWAAVRLGRLPVPAVSSVPESFAERHRPEPPEVSAAVARADEILAGLLRGLALVGAGGAVVLASTTGSAAPLTGALASVALMVRARSFPAVATRAPLLIAGVVGLVAITATTLVTAEATARLIGAASASIVVMVLLGVATAAGRRSIDRSPYLGRLADIVDVVTVVALVPVACAVLDVYSWVRGLAS